MEDGRQELSRRMWDDFTRADVEKLEELRQALADITSLLRDILQALTPENPEEIAVRTLVVTTAGTPRQFPDVPIPFDHEVYIEALNTNTGTMYVGNSSMEAADTSSSYPLLAGQGFPFKVKNLKQLWLNASVSGESVRWTVEKG